MLLLSSRRGRNPCRFPHDRRPHRGSSLQENPAEAPAPGSFGLQLTAQLNFPSLKNEKVRQAGTITNNMVIHICFYGLAPAVATPIHPPSKAWLTRLCTRGCVWGEYGRRIGIIKGLLNHDGLRILNNAGPDGPGLPMTTKPTGHHALQILPAMPC